MQVDAMTLLKKQMDEEVSALSGPLCEGAAKDFAEYREMCGKIYGLSRARLFVADMEARLQQDDE